MPPATSSWSTPVTGVQALQIDNKHPQPSNRVNGADLEGRKRRKITPISSVSKPENTVLLEDEQSEHALDKTASAATGTWDYLAKWETEDSAVIEDIPEADEEEYLSDVSDDSPGALEDQGHESDGGENLPPGGSIRKPSKLGEERVTEIVNECIETYANAWKSGKGETKHKGEDGKTEVPVVYDAVALWEEAEAAGQREELAAKYESEADYYRDRLDTLCEEISMDPGDTVAGIKMKCRNLEVTVEIIERAEWLASIYGLPPADSSEDESQDQHSVLPSEVQPPAIQPLRYTQHTSASQVIDLGTPSDTSDSEGEDPLPSDTPTTPALLNSSSKQEMIPQDRFVTSDPVVVDTIETPRPTVVAPTPTVVRSRVPLGDAPEHASIVTVSRWSWSRLKDTHDRKRAVSKAIYELSSADREIIRQRLWQVGRTNMIREIPACVGMLLHGEKKMPGILPQDLPKIVTFTRLFLCWWSCGNYLVENPSEEHLEELADCLRKSSPDPAIFCDYVDTILGTTFSLEALSKPTQPSQAEIIEISDDDEPAPRVSNPRKNNLYKPGSLQKTPAIIID